MKPVINNDYYRLEVNCGESFCFCDNEDLNDLILEHEATISELEDDLCNLEHDVSDLESQLEEMK